MALQRVNWRSPRVRYYVVAAVALVLLVGLWLAARRVSRPNFMPGAGRWGHFQVVGFYQNTPVSGQGPTSLASYRAHSRQITTVSPLWFSVAPNGSLSDNGADPSLVRLAHADHRLVVPLVTNAGGATQVLLRSSTRRLAAKNIVQAVRAHNLDGVDLDFELLKPWSRNDLNRFVADLAAKLKTLHKVLAVSVFPLVGLPSAVNGADDYAALAASANYLVIMAYDHHYNGSPPGPVAPYGWVQANVDQALKLAPARKLVLGIGMYGYDWIANQPTKPATTVSDVAAETLAKVHGVNPVYVADISQNTFSYTTNGVPHVVWYMGDRSAQARVALAEAKHLAGVALWQLGDEDPRFWRVMPSRP